MPLAFQTGRTGQLFVEFALTLAGAVLVSGFTALTLSPMMSARLLKHESSHGRFYMLGEAGEIRITDFSDRKNPVTQRFARGKQPYDALVTPDGRYYIAGLFGEDGLALIDLWNLDKGSRKILSGYGRGEQPLPVFKMPHLRGWSVAGGRA